MSHGAAYALIVSRMEETKDEVLASEMGCDRSQISRIRSGERGIRIKELDRLLTALGLTVCNEGDFVTMTAKRAEALETLAMEALKRGAQ